jgi:hypothetical protein
MIGASPMATCSERELFIPNAKMNKIVDVCNQALKEMKLKVIEEKSDAAGKTTILAAEGALVPLLMKVLLHPTGLDEYARAAQRSGIHVVISPSRNGVHLYTCGIALNEVSGKLKEYSKEDILEEVTDTIEEWDFEDSFIKKIKTMFPKTKEK